VRRVFSLILPCMHNVVDFSFWEWGLHILCQEGDTHFVHCRVTPHNAFFGWVSIPCHQMFCAEQLH
jgi:hypothetical protein